jgi:uncharacterized RDD family membrane protein YckC
MMSGIPESHDSEAPVEAEPEAGTRYIGLATRVIAFVLDAALINLVAVVVEVGAALILSLLHLPHGLKAVVIALGAAAYVLWTIGYFAAFWSTTGQTPGNRVMQIRVVSLSGGPLKPRAALLRCIGLLLAALPLFAGYVLILFDAKRRGFHDRLARTLVIEAPQLSIAETRRATKRAAYNPPRRTPPTAAA